MSGFKQYRRTQIAELRPWSPGEALAGRVSVSAADRDAGSPRPGDMIARNPKNHDDQWLVAAAYFAVNFEELTGPQVWSGSAHLRLRSDEPKDREYARDKRRAVLSRKGGPT